MRLKSIGRESLAHCVPVFRRRWHRTRRTDSLRPNSAYPFFRRVIEVIDLAKELSMAPNPPILLCSVGSIGDVGRNVQARRDRQRGKPPACYSQESRQRLRIRAAAVVLRPAPLWRSGPDDVARCLQQGFFHVRFRGGSLRYRLWSVSFIIFLPSGAG